MESHTNGECDNLGWKATMRRWRRGQCGERASAGSTFGDMCPAPIFAVLPHLITRTSWTRHHLLLPLTDPQRKGSIIDPCRFRQNLPNVRWAHKQDQGNA